jgi:quercetin dioxygenase-like cupin family protein
MNTFRVDFDAIPWTAPAPSVRFKAFREGRRQIRLVEFSEGFVEADRCRKGHIGYVLEGSGRLRFPDREEIAGAGDGIFIPSGEEHRHKLTVLSKVLKVVLVEDVA